VGIRRRWPAEFVTRGAAAIPEASETGRDFGTNTQPEKGDFTSDGRAQWLHGEFEAIAPGGPYLDLDARIFSQRGLRSELQFLWNGVT